MYKIEKNIPMPVSRKVSTYPFEEMEVCDSFLVTDKLERDIRAAAAEANRILKSKKFSVRKSKDEGENAFRVWRIL